MHKKSVFRAIQKNHTLEYAIFSPLIVWYKFVILAFFYFPIIVKTLYYVPDLNTYPLNGRFILLFGKKRGTKA